MCTDLQGKLLLRSANPARKRFNQRFPSERRNIVFALWQKRFWEYDKQKVRICEGFKWSFGNCALCWHFWRGGFIIRKCSKKRCNTCFRTYNRALGTENLLYCWPWGKSYWNWFVEQTLWNKGQMIKIQLAQGYIKYWNRKEEKLHDKSYIFLMFHVKHQSEKSARSVKIAGSIMITRSE